MAMSHRSHRLDAEVFLKLDPGIATVIDLPSLRVCGESGQREDRSPIFAFGPEEQDSGAAGDPVSFVAKSVHVREKIPNQSRQ